MTPLLRDLLPADRSAWGELFRDYQRFHDMPPDDATAMQVWAAMTGPSSQQVVRVAMNGPRMLGFASYIPWSRTGIEAHIEEFYVIQQARNQRLGTLLFDDVVQLARARGCSSIHCSPHDVDVAAQVIFNRFATPDRAFNYIIPITAGFPPPATRSQPDHGSGPKLRLRNAMPMDELRFRQLWEGFGSGYGLKLPEEVTAFTWARMMDHSNPLTLRLACLDGTPQGFAIHQHHPSTWVLGDDGYLEDLYVDPSARGQGLGRALIEDLIAISRAKGWHRLYWLTEISNTAARRLYDQFCENDGHIRYRMTL